MKNINKGLYLIFLLVLVSACSVVMAAKQPSRKDLSVLTKGVDRSRVIAELGPPIHSEVKDAKKVDIFSFTQGYSGGAKAGRALFHGVADVFTLGLWEVAGTPIEGAASGTEVKVEVNYDSTDRVDNINVYSGKEKVDEASADANPPPEGQPTIPSTSN